MPQRNGYIASGFLHLFLVLLFIFGLPDLFRHDLPTATPLVVQIVKIGPETRATQVTHTPPTPEAKPTPVVAPPEPKPTPPKPVPPKPAPQPPTVLNQPPPTPVPPTPQPKVQPPPKPAPRAPAPVPKPAPPPPVPAPAPKPAPPPPIAKPVPPAPPPPVPSPKPTPPSAEARPQPTPRPPPPKPRPPKPQAQASNNSFDSLLRNLEKNQPTPGKATPDRSSNTPPQRASSQPIAPLASRLLASQLDLVKEQIEQCWAIPAGVRDAADLMPEFRVTMNPDATVRGAQLLNTGQYSDPTFRAAADSARRALLNRRCQPLKLPLDKYAMWQTFTITFDPKDVN
jgi:hypothetical protein